MYSCFHVCPDWLIYTEAEIVFPGNIFCINLQLCNAAFLNRRGYSFVLCHITTRTVQIFNVLPAKSTPSWRVISQREGEQRTLIGSHKPPSILDFCYITPLLQIMYSPDLSPIKQDSKHLAISRQVNFSKTPTLITFLCSFLSKRRHQNQTSNIMKHATRICFHVKVIKQRKKWRQSTLSNKCTYSIVC